MTDTALHPETLSTEGWWPSRYGPDDEAGALNELARDRVHEFLLVMSHARLRGATGAWVAPVAIT